MSEQTLNRIRMHLKVLKLTRMDKALDEELSRAAKDCLPPSQVLESLLAIEANALIDRRIERRIRESKLPERKLLADFDFIFQKGVDKGQIMERPPLILWDESRGL